jgi:hypothetical protein
MSLFGDLIDGGVNAVGVKDTADRLNELGNNARTELENVGQEAIDGTVFNPVGVVTNTGNTKTDADGNIVATLSPQQQAASDAALAASQGMFNEAGQSTADRTNDIFSAASAAFQPEFMRQNTQVANDLYSSGRTGFGGGSSEQYANRQSQEQSLLNAYFGARTQAGQEQVNQVNAANGALSGSMAGNAALFENQGVGIQQANLQQVGQIAGQNQNVQANVSGIQTQLNSNVTAANLEQGLFSEAAGLAGQTAGVVGNAYGNSGNGKSFLENLVSELF